MKKRLLAASLLGVMSAASPANAGTIEDVANYLAGNPLPLDREANARAYISDTACKSQTRGIDRDKCIDQFVQRERQKSSAVREQNEQLEKKQYLGCLLAKGFASHECDWLTPSKPVPSR
jgi:hypothetical protein